MALSHGRVKLAVTPVPALAEWFTLVGAGVVLSLSPSLKEMSKGYIDERD